MPKDDENWKYEYARSESLRYNITELEQMRRDLLRERDAEQERAMQDRITQLDLEVEAAQVNNDDDNEIAQEQAINCGRTELRRQQVRTGRHIGQADFDGIRWVQLQEEIQRYRGDTENVDIMRTLEGLVNNIENRSEELKDMSKIPDQRERIEELEKILFMLLDHLGLMLKLKETKTKCGDNYCQSDNCKHEKKWHIETKPKNYEEKVTKIDDLIIIGDDEK